MLMLKLTLVGLICLLTFSSLSKAQDKNIPEALVVLPTLSQNDYGMGLGANALWTSIMNSGFSAFSDLQYANSANYTQLNLDVTNHQLLDILYFNAGVNYERSLNAHFYGMGNESRFGDPHYYSFRDSTYYARLGINIFDLVTIGMGYKKRSIGIGRSENESDAQFFDYDSTHPRASGINTTSLSIFALFDSRNSQLTPTQGLYIFSELEQNQPSALETMSSQRVFVDSRYYIPFWSGDVTLATRLRYERIWGEDIPFFAQSSIGGLDTVRAWRSNRYVSSGSTVANVEARWKGFDVGGAITRIEPSFGLDFGRVFDIRTFPPIPPFEGYHNGWDFGLTAILSSNVPVRLDLAQSGDGILFYLHLMQPF
jgi:outer membrane protein assembly factor BamA